MVTQKRSRRKHGVKKERLSGKMGEEGEGERQDKMQRRKGRRMKDTENGQKDPETYAANPKRHVDLSLPPL
jgi:hypothetical protein